MACRRTAGGQRNPERSLCNIAPGASRHSPGAVALTTVKCGGDRHFRGPCRHSRHTCRCTAPGLRRPVNRNTRKHAGDSASRVATAYDRSVAVSAALDRTTATARRRPLCRSFTSRVTNYPRWNRKQRPCRPEKLPFRPFVTFASHGKGPSPGRRARAAKISCP